MGLRSTRRPGATYESSPRSAAFRCQAVSDRRSRFRGTGMAVALIAAVTVPLFFLGLGERNIWIPLEARYALVAREMMETGYWILPHLGGEVYADKPPMLFWCIA